MRVPSTLWRLAVWFLLAAGPCACQAFAGSGNLISLPAPGKKPASGLTLEVDSRWVEGNGYRPIRIKLSPANGQVVKTTRTVKVRIQSRGSSAPYSASAWIELPQGKTYGEATIPLPQTGLCWTIGIETTEGGRPIRELCEETIGMQMPRNHEWTEAAPTFLFIVADAQRGAPSLSLAGVEPQLPDVRTLLSHFRASEGPLQASEFSTKRELDDIEMVNFIAKLPRAIFLPPSALPSRWVEQSSIDWIVISMDDLRQLHRDTQRFEAVRRLIAAGATLCVYAVGESWERLAELEALVELAPQRDGAARTDRGWNQADPARFSAAIAALRNGSFGSGDYSELPTSVPQQPCPFVWRTAETGRVVALGSRNPFPGQPADWAWIFNSFPESPWMWYSRFGMSMNRVNHDHWNLMVPGVGSAPVNSFLVLITIFVLVVGPLIYFFLRRFHRLQLLLLAVPSSAALVTVALLLYALVDDGLGVRARARTVTTLNQHNQRVVTWGRHAYYAGLAPSAGLVYSTDAVIHAMDHNPPRHSGPLRHTFWLEKQHLDSGYLRSRTMAQLMVVQSRKTKTRLDIEPQEGGQPPLVTNRLGVRLRQLVLRGGDDSLYFGVNLNPGSSVRLESCELAEFETNWLQAMDQFAPGFPPGFHPSDIENASSIFDDRWRYRETVDRTMARPNSRTSVLERGFTEARKLSALPPRAYLALVDRAPDLELGVPRAGEEASLHLVKGTW